MNRKLKKLIKAIKKIDPEASKYIEKTVLPRYGEKQPPDDLPGLFLWSHSPHGNQYWTDIYLKLEGK
jgi:hypothetical protein